MERKRTQLATGHPTLRVLGRGNATAWMHAQTGTLEALLSTGRNGNVASPASKNRSKVRCAATSASNGTPMVGSSGSNSW